MKLKEIIQPRKNAEITKMGEADPVHQFSMRSGRSLAANQRRERGSVVLLLILLLGIMAVYLASNNLVLNQLHRELGLLEKNQKEKFSRPAVPTPRDKTPSKP